MVPAAPAIGRHAGAYFFVQSANTPGALANAFSVINTMPLRVRRCSSARAFPRRRGAANVRAQNILKQIDSTANAIVKKTR